MRWRPDVCIAGVLCAAVAVLGCGSDGALADAFEGNGFEGNEFEEPGENEMVPGAGGAPPASDDAPDGMRQAPGAAASSSATPEGQPGSIPLSEEDAEGTAGTEPDAPRGPSVAITIQSAGGAFGLITSTPTGVRCSAPPCRIELPRGTTLRLNALSPVSGGIGFAGWAGACEGLADCTLLLDGDDLRLTAAYERANLVFVTSTLFAGNFGGMAQADAICAERAALAQLPGTFRAWLSSEAVDAIERLEPYRGWVRRDGRLVADTPRELADGRLFHPLRIDELGQDVGERRVWTGSERDGRAAAGLNCSNWTDPVPNAPSGVATGGTGDSSLGGRNFSFYGSAACGTPASLYCFEVGRSLRVAPIPSEGRRAFISASAFASGGGIATADALCERDALVGGLTGSFRALLATTGASPASRFDLSGPAWVRLDGIPVAATASAFSSGTSWDTSLNVTATRSYLDNDNVLVGGTTLLAPGTADTTCSDWTSTEGTLTQGNLASTDPINAFHSRAGGLCSSTYHAIACLER